MSLVSHHVERKIQKDNFLWQINLIIDWSPIVKEVN